MTVMTPIAFLGLGAMGSRMAARLLDAGHDLVVWNRTPERAEHLVAAGAVRAETPAAAAAQAELVITMLADPAALEAVTDGPDGVARALAPTATLVEMSTVGPAAIERLAAALHPERLLDAPVLGSLSEAEEGRLQVFVGGSRTLAERWAPVFEVLGTPTHVGPLGSGARAKLVANSTLFGVLGVLGEAVALGDALGLDRDVLFTVLSGTPVGAQVERRRPVLEGEESPVRFALSLAVKDAELVGEAAAAHGADLRLAAAARSWLADAEHAGWGERDYSAVLSYVLERAVSPESRPEA
jgi:3-hydroxyisobutyrate dehydrogenase/2-hydroxy-3-oxopropionate reductase